MTAILHNLLFCAKNKHFYLTKSNLTDWFRSPVQHSISSYFVYFIKITLCQTFICLFLYAQFSFTKKEISQETNTAAILTPTSPHFGASKEKLMKQETGKQKQREPCQAKIVPYSRKGVQNHSSLHQRLHIWLVIGKEMETWVIKNSELL